MPSTNVEDVGMWNVDKQARFDELRALEQHKTLTVAEQEELEALLQELDAIEAVYLQPATQHLHLEREALAAQNRQLTELLHEHQMYLTEVREVVDALETHEQWLHDRFTAITGRAWDSVQTEASE